MVINKLRRGRKTQELRAGLDQSGFLWRSVTHTERRGTHTYLENVSLARKASNFICPGLRKVHPQESGTKIIARQNKKRGAYLEFVNNARPAAA
jgi:hypothetical protein